MQRAPAELLIAPPLMRSGAFFIDLFILLPVVLGIDALVIEGFNPREQTIESYVIALITQAIYSIGFVSLYRATPGKMALGLTIVRADGQPLMPDTAILRYLVFMIANMLFPIGTGASVVMMLMDPSRRTLHDRVAGTLVMLKRRRPARDARP